HDAVPVVDFAGAVALARGGPGGALGGGAAGIAPRARVPLSRRRLRRHARAVRAVGAVADMADVREDRGTLAPDRVAARAHGAARGPVARGDAGAAGGRGRGAHQPGVGVRWAS